MSTEETRDVSTRITDKSSTEQPTDKYDQPTAEPTTKSDDSTEQSTERTAGIITSDVTSELNPPTIDVTTEVPSTEKSSKISDEPTDEVPTESGSPAPITSSERPTEGPGDITTISEPDGSETPTSGTDFCAVSQDFEKVAADYCYETVYGDLANSKCTSVSVLVRSGIRTVRITVDHFHAPFIILHQ